MMKLIKADEQARLLALLKKSKKRLMCFQGVHHVDVGYAYKRGRPTNTLAIRVHVDNKRPESELKREQVLPDEIEGVSVDVLETHPELQLVNRTARLSPMMPGIEVRNISLGIAGTLGAIVFDRNTLQPMGLSNAHVLFGTFRDVVNQPATTAASDRVGLVNRRNNFFDAAAFSLDGPATRMFNLQVADLSAPPTITDTAAIFVGTRVVKSGRTTGVTFGIVDGVNNVFAFSVVPDPAKPAAGGQISSAGDSGSVWLDAATHRAVGLHYAGEQPGRDRSWAKRIGGVLDKLDVFFFDTVAVSRIFIANFGGAIGLTRPNAPCHLRIIYPSGRVSTAKGLGDKTAAANGWVRWDWKVGTDTHRHDPKKGLAEFTLDGRIVSVPFLPERQRVITP